MKKCPFCAEEIQGDAIKCKHCGEWLKEKKQPFQADLPHQLPSKDINNPKRADADSPRSNSSINTEKQVIHDSNRDDDDADDERHYKSPMKKKNRWGWGWFILLLCYSSYIRELNKKPLTEKPSSIVFLIGTAVLFYSYFWWRNKLIGKFNELWKVSFVAGILAMFTYGIISLILILIGL